MNDKKSSKVDRCWNEYPLGTKVPSILGGYWKRAKLGWKWCPFSETPTPQPNEVKSLQKKLRDFKLLLAIVNTSLDDPNCDIPELQEMISEALKS